MRRVIFIFVFAFLFTLFPLTAMANKSILDLDSPGNWQGLEIAEDGAKITLPGQAVYTYPDGPEKKGWYEFGFERRHDGASNWMDYDGISLELELPKDMVVELTLEVKTPDIGKLGRTDLITSSKANFTVAGKGAKTAKILWQDFNFSSVQPLFLKFVKTFSVKAESKDGDSIVVRDIKLLKADVIGLSSEIRGLSSGQSEQVKYKLNVTNYSDQKQSVTLIRDEYGWEATEVTISPSKMVLEPGQSTKCNVVVRVGHKMPPGSHEKQIIRAIPNGDSFKASQIEFMTAAALRHPYIVHTKEGWDEVSLKKERYDWAKEAADKYIEQADRWVVPEMATVKDPNADYLFKTTEEKNIMASAYAWRLTRDRKYARKVSDFLLRMSDPKTGYAKTQKGCHQSFVQEGHFFQHLAMAYDMVLDSGAVPFKRRPQIERMFRIYMNLVDLDLQTGAISNWHVSQLCGALYSALAIQDMERAYRFIYGRGGIIDEISAGALDDGWWYECAVGYNTWVTSEFTETAIALMPWGINFRDMHFPQRYTNYIGMRVWERKDGLFGMSFQKWGPFHKNYNTIKNMWNSLLEFADYRGVMFGANDATERMLASEPYELAYYVYRDPAYAAVVKRGKERNLIYGVPELPEDTPVLGTKSVYADNAGIAVLRSQTKDRPQSEQIQAAIKYGTHGSFHGHFDRASLLSIMRYGRYPWNPEATWYGYGSFMYKFWVQPSVSHNMVTVDLKQQKPKESSRMMFYSGEMIQAAVAETNADWENPPFGGITQKHSLAEQCWKEGRYLPIPENAPAYGSVSDRTEPILQRRLLAVTDDYVVLADYIYSGREHVYDNLFHFKGLQEFTAAKKTFVKHTEQFTCDPLSAAQFITNCDWYDVNAPAKFTFEMQWGEGADNAGTRTSYCEDGSLKMDVYSVWPPRASVMVGAYPENHNVNRRLRYQVIGDEKVLAEGKFGAWILGKDKIEVDIKGMNELKLRTSVENARDAETIFWADAKIITNSGKQISLNDLNLNRDNVSADIKSGLDYKGGPVVIQGQKYNDTLAADPIEDKEPGLITVDLKKLGAVKFVASIGGDYPVGDETWRRKTVSIRTKTKATMFLTVIEPYEDQPMIESAVAMSPFDIEVKLKDGRTQNLTIENLHLDHMDISVNITETKNGEETRKEVATSIIYQ